MDYWRFSIRDLLVKVLLVHDLGIPGHPPAVARTAKHSQEHQRPNNLSDLTPRV
jgi:hypothetical protein